MGKVHDFKEEMALHEQSELNVYRKHPQLTACDRRVTVYNRHTQQKVQAIMFDQTVTWVQLSFLKQFRRPSK